jgi:hypothetical protein
MSLFQTTRGGQGLVNTYQFQSSVGLPDPSIMLQGVKSQSASQGRSRVSESNSEKERKFTPGQQRAYDAERMNLLMKRQEVENKWLNIAEEEYGGLNGKFLRERRNDMMRDSLELVMEEKKIEEANAMRERNFERFNKLGDNKDFLNNILLDNSGQAFGVKVTYDNEGKPVSTGEVGWGHITDSGFMPMTGKQALPFLYQDDSSLSVFLNNASEYDVTKWEEDLNTYIGTAVGSIIGSSGTNERFNWSNTSNVNALQAAIDNAPLLLSASNKSGALNEAIQRGPVPRIDYTIDRRGTIIPRERMDERGQVMTIDPRANPGDAMAQLMRDKAAVQAATRANINIGQTLRTDRGNESEIKRHPWLDIAMGITPITDKTVITLGQRNLSQETINQELNKFVLSHARSQEIARHRERFLRTLTPGQQNMTPREQAAAFTQYLREHATGLGNLPADAALRGYGQPPYTGSALVNSLFPKLVYAADSPTLTNNQIATSVFQPSQMRNILAGQYETRERDGSVRYGDYVVGLSHATADMVASFAEGYNNKLPGAHEFLFPGANYTNLKQLIGNIEPVYEFTGRILSAPDTNGVQGMYVETYAYFTRDQVDRLMINKLDGSGTNVREVSVRAKNYHDFTVLENPLSAGQGYGDNTESLRNELTTALKNAPGGKLYRVPMYVLLDVNHAQTFDDIIKKRDQEKMNYSVQTAPYRQQAVGNAVNNIQGAIVR